MVLAVEQPIEDLAQRADVMQVVQDDDEGQVHSVVLTGALVSKVGQVLAQFLQTPGKNKWVMYPMTTYVYIHSQPSLRPGHVGGKAFPCCALACSRGLVCSSRDAGWAGGEESLHPAFGNLLGNRELSAQGKSIALWKVPGPASVSLLYCFSTRVVIFLDIPYCANLPGRS